MTAKIVFRIGADLEQLDRDILANCEAAALAAEHGENIKPTRTVSFESWTTFFRSVTPNRIAVLEYVAEHDAVASTRALATALGRDYAAVHADVTALLKLRLLEREGNALRCEVGPHNVEMVAA
jgi:predicted transcriptional regulator